MVGSDQSSFWIELTILKTSGNRARAKIWREKFFEFLENEEVFSMMEEPVLLPQEYSVACDSLVQEDAQGRQESFDSSI